MKTIKFISITGLLSLCFGVSALAQQNQNNRPAFNAEQVVKSIDKAVNLSEEQKVVLKKRAAEIIQNRKMFTKMPKDSTYHSIPFVVDSILTDSQKETMKDICKKKCDAIINKNKH